MNRISKAETTLLYNVRSIASDIEDMEYVQPAAADYLLRLCDEYETLLETIHELQKECR